MEIKPFIFKGERLEFNFCKMKDYSDSQKTLRGKVQSLRQQELLDPADESVNPAPTAE